MAKASREGRGGTLHGFPHHPAMVLVWWFVPIASLYLPFRVLQDVWIWMDPGDDDALSRPPGIFTGWWATRIAAGVLGVLAVCVRGSEGMGELVSVVSAVVECVSLVLAWAVVGAFHTRHTAWLARVGLGA